MVHTCADDDHRFTMRFMRVFSELTCDLDNALTAKTCDDFLPSRRARNRLVILIIGDVLAANTIINTKVSKG